MRTFCCGQLGDYGAGVEGSSTCPQRSELGEGSPLLVTRKVSPPGRGRNFLHVDEDLVSTQEPGLERWVEPGEARGANRSQACRGDVAEKLSALPLVRRL